MQPALPSLPHSCCRGNPELKLSCPGTPGVCSLAALDFECVATLPAVWKALSHSWWAFSFTLFLILLEVDDHAHDLSVVCLERETSLTGAVGEAPLSAVPCLRSSRARQRRHVLGHHSRCKALCGRASLRESSCVHRRTARHPTSDPRCVRRQDRAPTGVLVARVLWLSGDPELQASKAVGTPDCCAPGRVLSCLCYLSTSASMCAPC